MFERRLRSLTARTGAPNVRFGVVDLDQPRRLERLLGDPRHIAHRILDAPAVAAEVAVDARDQPADQRRHRQRNDSETAG